MDIIQKYSLEKQYLSSIKDYRFPYLDIGKVMATQIWKTLNRSKKEIIKRICSVILFDKYLLNINVISNSHSLLLSASAGELRGDNSEIINNAKQFIEPCNEIVLRKTNSFSIKHSVTKIKITCKYFRRFKEINSVVDRIYFAANMSIVYQLSHDLDDLLAKIDFVLTFMDTDIFENYITQTVQNFGGKVAALQHGQRFYIPEPCDSYVGMENFTANYKLVWSKFSRQQYMKAGYKENRLPIVGSTKYLNNTTIKDNSVVSNSFGLFLDGPFSYGAKSANEIMLNISANVLNKDGLKCKVKPHPVDKLDYCGTNDIGLFTIVDKDDSIESMVNEIDFGIVHTSGVAIDLLILGVPVFVFKTKDIFPIELPEQYFFENEQQLELIIEKYYLDRNEFMKNFGKIREQYVEPDPYKLHKDFFHSLGKC